MRNKGAQPKERLLNCKQQEGYLKEIMIKEEGVCGWKNVYVTGSQRVWHHRPRDKEVLSEPERRMQEMKILLNYYWASSTLKANSSFSPSPLERN